MDHDPETHRESESKPNQITRRLVDGRKTFALRAADAQCHGHKRPDEQRSKNDGRDSESDRNGRHQRSEIIGLLLTSWSIDSVTCRSGWGDARVAEHVHGARVAGKEPPTGSGLQEFHLPEGNPSLARRIGVTMLLSAAPVTKCFGRSTNRPGHGPTGNSRIWTKRKPGRSHRAAKRSRRNALRRSKSLGNSSSRGSSTNIQLPQNGRDCAVTGPHLHLDSFQDSPCPASAGLFIPTVLR
jgi:hypothetical protein